MGEKQGAREAVERMAARIKSESRGRMSADQAKEIARNSCLRVNHNQEKRSRKNG